ncbi:uncharacterized protein TRIADDRAFT_53260 [Trichoplax adhaerens]|uniref:Cyclin-like domain-containing protein n=1 Tax=Trichoplax adhaerens TaxID=10228 RepID=B3RNR5_TRIAD|nr:hypothetical protein TRIADDRAFT_53260 [Trichoplax adhaerens]EDV27507.1 hypothetical protein TRIADDRAFT_53260 [Trichoplax adhaerens]|eukprot:XP_002109341.1 hypothetical protein TRIADDRAFT_53260 [Trichoplax adhaerens]
MYHTSTQRKYWTFPNEEEIAQHKGALHNQFFQKLKDDDSRHIRTKDLPSVEELDHLCTFYEFELMDLCRRFDPPMPATAAVYMKRFYLVCSVMDYHPCDIMLACVYLATKVDEYNISIDKFLTMVPENDKERAKSRTLGFELLVMEKLKFHLTIHCPYRPVEGLLINIMTVIPEIADKIDELRRHIDKFLSKILYCQAMLIYPPSQVGEIALFPSQIALAAIIEAGEKAGLDLFESVISAVLNNNS